MVYAQTHTEQGSGEHDPNELDSEHENNKK